MQAGGGFRKVNGTARVGLALVDSKTGKVIKGSPVVPYLVIDLAATETQLFVGGGGTNANGSFSGNIAAAFDLESKELQWAAQGDGNVQAVDVISKGDFVYFGGHYQGFQFILNDDSKDKIKGTNIEGEGIKVERVSRHNKDTGEIDTTWTPFVDGIRSVNALDVTKTGLYMVGDFTQVGGVSTVVRKKLTARPKLGIAAIKTRKITAALQCLKETLLNKLQKLPIAGAMHRLKGI